MTTNTDIVNRALQKLGTRTTVTDAELVANDTNEAIQANLVLTKYRDQLLRMAPWSCAFNYNNLTLVTAAPGTPENTTSGTEQWEKGLPPPPWVYEYQYPVDCVKACFIVPQYQTGFAGGVPITTAVTGGSPAYWRGPPVAFQVIIDQFFPVTAAAVVAGGTGYVIGDEVTLETWATGEVPFGAPAKLLVATLSGSAVATVTVVNQIAGQATPKGGSYLIKQTGTQTQEETTGSGTGATFTLTYGAKSSQRVIVTNQQNAILAYVKQVDDPNVMDEMFIEAWASLLASAINMGLTGDKTLSNMLVKAANDIIEQARTADANEGLTVNDVTPDFIRVRGVDWSVYGWTPFNTDWGGLWPAW